MGANPFTTRAGKLYQLHLIDCINRIKDIHTLSYRHRVFTGATFGYPNNPPVTGRKPWVSRN